MEPSVILSECYDFFFENICHCLQSLIYCFYLTMLFSLIIFIAYMIPHWKISGHVVKTDSVPSCAMRGPGLMFLEINVFVICVG